MSVATTEFDNIFNQYPANTMRLYAAINFLGDFFLNNSTPDPVIVRRVNDKYVAERYWNDIYHVRQPGEQSLEAQFVQMFDKLCEFLMEQPSDDLALMTLHIGIARYHLFIATDICTNCNETWKKLSDRLWPRVKNW